MTTLQLNPDTSDGYEVFTLAEMRQKVFDAVGFISPFTGDGTLTLGEMRAMIINRLGLALALLANFDTFDNILSDVYNAGGYASIGATHPPGVDNLLTTIINDAQRTLFARVEMDQGGKANPPTLSTGISTAIDATAVRLLAIAELKAHQGKADAGGYAQQVEKYLSDLTQRTPPNIIGQINAAIVQAHQNVWRRWELGQSDFNTELGTIRGQSLLAMTLKGTYNTTAYDAAPTVIDAYPVYTLALANLKKRIGHPDADPMFADVEAYFKQLIVRFPPNATTIVNRALKDAQDTLYRRYSVFRMERWYTWTMVPNQRFYPLYGYDGASSQAPTNLIVTEQTPGGVTSHDMITGRRGAMYTLLNDGRVLIAGGVDANFGYLASAEIFDPATGTFSATGSMGTARSGPSVGASVGHMGCLMQDGRFFVSGGYPKIKTTEIYDSSTGAWTPGPDMTVARDRHTCTTLLDGTVLIVGYDSTTAAAHVVDLFDPQTNTITALAAATTYSYQNGTGTLLPDGRVLLTGANASTAAEIYDPVAKTFTIAGAMNQGHTEGTATRLTNGKVLIAGGGTDVVELFDPATNNFTVTGSLPDLRIRSGAVLLANQKTLVIGGESGLSLNTPDTDTQLYDQAAGTFTSGPTAPFASLCGAYVTLQDGRVLIAGGYTTHQLASVTSRAMLYDENANTIALTGSLTQGDTYYEVTAFTANGESLPSNEAFILTVPASTAVKIAWTPVVKQPFVLGFNVYRGKTTGAEGFIASVPATQTSYIDQGTIPQGAPPPTINTTPGKRSIDPRHIAWVGLSLNGNVWNPLIAGIPPIAYTANISGIPTNYEIRDAIELWPPPRDATWQMQIKGYFPPQIFESDDDVTTIDWQAILYQTIADVLPKFPGRFDKEAIADARRRVDGYIKELTAGTYKTQRFIPGSATQRNLIRPVFTGTYETYP